MHYTTNKKYWNTRWGNFARIYKVKKWDGIWGKKGSFIRIIERYIGCINKKKILELGGAMSYFALSMAKWCNADVTLLDFSSEGINKTEVLYSLNKCRATFLCKDMFKMESNSIYDVVTHWGVMEHFVNPSDVFDVCSKFLKPGGFVVFSMPNMDSYGAYLWKNLNKNDWEKHIYHSDDTIVKSAQENGYILKNKFFWGAPLIQISPCKPNQLLRFFLQVIQYGFYIIGIIIPIYHYGLKKVSIHRGFVFQKEVIAAKDNS